MPRGPRLSAQTRSLSALENKGLEQNGSTLWSSPLFGRLSGASGGPGWMAVSSGCAFDRTCPQKKTARASVSRFGCKARLEAETAAILAAPQPQLRKAQGIG